MTGAKKGIVPGVFIFAGIFWLVLLIAVSVRADPTVLVYPSTVSVFRYDPDHYEIRGPGDPGYVPIFAIGEQMLWDKVAMQIAREFVRAPGLTGFEPCDGGGSEYRTQNSEFDIIVDGYGDAPRALANLYMRILPISNSSEVTVEIDGVEIEGLTQRISDFTVSTPTGDGHFADTMEYHINWSGTSSVRIVVFSDKNLNGIFDDGPPLLSLVAESDTPIPVEKTSWGVIKSLYSE